MIFGINTTRDISKLSQISLAWRLVQFRITISKYHSWDLCQISLQFVLLPILIRHFHLSIMHLVCPPKFCIRIVFIFFWDGCNTQEKWKTKVMRNLGRRFINKVYYGKCGSGVWCLYTKSLLCCRRRTVFP